MHRKSHTGLHPRKPFALDSQQPWTRTLGLVQVDLLGPCARRRRGASSGEAAATAAPVCDAFSQLEPAQTWSERTAQVLEERKNGRAREKAGAHGNKSEREVWSASERVNESE
eukprot:7440-Rhodomonas_salina.1